MLALATNDALSANAKNLGILNTSNVYFVPVKQDNYEESQGPWWPISHSLSTILKALEGEQLQPILCAE